MASEQLVYQNFAQAMTTPAIISVNQLTPPPSFDPTTTTIKMEDLTIPLNLSTPPPSSLPPTSHPTPSSSDAKPVKKRKSWGQVLPEPKTNLPPRKRAKTEDEKEQRRIERVKRNRLAAHNSRERKRQEVEQLQAEKDKLEDELKQAKATMALMAAQIQAFQARHPDEALECVFDSSSSYASSSSPDFIRDSSETICPRQTSFPSPPSTDSAASPRDDSCQPETPAYTESVATDLDQTRYPAAILCDLLCQSSSATTSPAPSLQSTLASPTLSQPSTLASTKSPWTTSSASTSSPNSPTTPLPPLTTAWTPPTSSPRPSSTQAPQTPMVSPIPLMQRPSTCRQPLAQLTLATGFSQRGSNFKWMTGSEGSKVCVASEAARFGTRMGFLSLAREGNSTRVWQWKWEMGAESSVTGVCMAHMDTLVCRLGDEYHDEMKSIGGFILQQSRSSHLIPVMFNLLLFRCL